MMKDKHELEVYAPIKDFPNYLITSHGRVLSLRDNVERYRIKELKLRKNKCGYIKVGLYKNGKQEWKTVHKLVAQAFIPNPDNKPQVNHIDENKANNHVSNLEWTTAKENVNYGTRNERASKALSKTMSDGRRKGLNHKNCKSVIGINVKSGDIKFYSYIKQCEKDGFYHQDISKCCKGKLKTSKGYKWFYTDDYFNKERIDTE